MTATPTVHVTLDPGATMPTQATPGSAGHDLTVPTTVTVPADGTTTIVSTGVHVAIPDGYAGLVIARSSLHRRHLRLTNGVGVIDSDYRGPIRLTMTTTEDTLTPVTVPAGERVAQLLIVPCAAAFNQVDALPPTGRGVGGFGSTGRA